MQGGWHDFDIWKERQRDLLREAEARRLARAGHPAWKERLGDYHGLFDKITGWFRETGRQVTPSGRGFPPTKRSSRRERGPGWWRLFSRRDSTRPAQAV